MTDPKSPDDDPAPDAPPDLNDLAKRYLDLWQAQVNTMAGDADAAKTMADTMAMMSAGAQSFSQAFAEAAQKQSGARQNDHGSPAPAAPAGAAHGDPGARLDEFAERLAAVEERLARMESELGRIVGGDRQDDA